MGSPLPAKELGRRELGWPPQTVLAMEARARRCAAPGDWGQQLKAMSDSARRPLPLGDTHLAECRRRAHLCACGARGTVMPHGGRADEIGGRCMGGS